MPGGFEERIIRIETPFLLIISWTPQVNDQPPNWISAAKRAVSICHVLANQTHHAELLSFIQHPKLDCYDDCDRRRRLQSCLKLPASRS